MAIIDLVFGTFFGLIMRLCYLVTDSFGWAIIAFTLLTKAILFPISLISQRNSIVMVKMQPQLAELQAFYANEPSTLLKEQRVLYKKEKYSSLKAILPLLVQIPLIIGVISVVNNPSRHIGENVEPLFFGADLFAVPEGLLIPALAIVSTLMLCVMQNKYNVISREQGFIGKWGVAVFLVAFTGWFSFAAASGVVLYWTYSNLFGIVSLAVCNIVYDPKKHIDYENRSITPKLTKAEKMEKRERRRVEKIREKEDMKRFFSVKKELVFYSDSSGFYKYFQHYIEYILENSEITVHYLTADIGDQVLKIDRPRFETYFCTPNGLITTFMKMDADIVVMTMPDLQVYHYKRSLVKKDIEYIYADHGTGSFHLTHRKGAIDNYDTIFCYSKNHNEEVRAIERTYGLPEKKLVNVGFGLLDMLIEQHGGAQGAQKDRSGGPPQILIAPSWQKDNILDYCLDPLLGGLSVIGAKIIIRPHPEYVKRFPGKVKAIMTKYGSMIGQDFEIQTDFSSNSTVYDSDLIITDWSSVAQEFSFTTKKPSMFINTPMKIMNPEWQRIGIEPMDIWIRDVIGVSLDVDKLEDVGRVAQELLDDSKKYEAEIEDLLENHMYNIGRTAKVGGGYIIERIEQRTGLTGQSQPKTLTT